MKLLVSVFTVTLTACGACNPTPSAPDAAPIVPDKVDAAGVYAELVEAGCVDPTDDAGLAAVVEARTDDAAPSWVLCLFQGGTVAQCGACPSGSE